MKPLEIINEIKAGLLNTSVYICGLKEIGKLNIEKMSAKTKGCYYSTLDCLLSKNIIFINKRNPDYIKIAIFFHEYQHYLCDINFKDFNEEYEEEEDALRAQLKQCIAYSLYRSLEWSIKYINDLSHNYNSECINHRKASCSIIKSKLWKKCNKFLKEIKKNDL